MTFSTYSEARAALDAINDRIRANTCPAIDAGAAAHEAYRAEKFAIAADAKSAGFTRIFSGNYKLNAGHVALVDEAA